MKKMLLLCGALLIVGAAAAMAAPTLHLHYDACGGADGGLSVTTFACTNAGSNALIMSFTPDVDMPTYQGAIMDVNISTGGALPAWWLANCSATRTSVLGFAADNTVLGTCSNDSYGNGPAGFAGIGGIAPISTGLTIEVGTANAPGSEPNLAANVEVYAGTLSIKHAGTTSTGCSGCSTPACINFVHGGMDYLGHPTVMIEGNLVAGDSYVAWQAVSAAACLGATPTKTTTWGGIKSLYR